MVQAIIWGISLVILAKHLLTRLFDADFWWHLSSARWMLQNQAFLTTDPFSHTLHGQPWINFEWLAQILMFFIFNNFGVPGVMFAKIALSLISLGLLGWAVRIAGARGPWVLFLLWVGFFVIRPRYLERPELATLIFFPLFCAILLQARQSQAWQSLKTSVGLALVMGVWVNLHAGFVYGGGLVALFWMGAFWAREKKSFQIFLGRTAALCFLALFFNPTTYKIFVVLWEHLTQLSGGPVLLSEWLAPTLSQVPLFWLLFFGCSALMIAGVLQRWPGIRFWIPAVIAFAVTGATFYRNTPFLAFVGLPFAVAMLGPVFQKKKNKIFTKKAAVLGWTACCVWIALFFKTADQPVPSSLVAWHRFPVQAAQFLKKENIKGQLFNSYDFGGYLQWALGPSQKVFMDGRYLFYPLLEDYAVLLAEPPEPEKKILWASYFSRYKVDIAVMKHDELDGQAELMFPPEDWALVFWDDTALVFLDRQTHESVLEDRVEFKRFVPYKFDPSNFDDRFDLEWNEHKRQVAFSVIRNEWEKRRAELEGQVLLQER